MDHEPIQHHTSAVKPDEIALVKLEWRDNPNPGPRNIDDQSEAYSTSICEIRRKNCYFKELTNIITPIHFC